MQTTKHWINGAFTAPADTRLADVTNPATGKTTSQVALASEETVNEAVAAAAAAFPAWRSGNPQTRRQSIWPDSRQPG